MNLEELAFGPEGRADGSEAGTRCGERILMGMYTQIRGWLCVKSIGALNDGPARLKTAQDTFVKKCERPWVKENTWFHQGSNGACWLFIGVEYKNYDDSFDLWLKHLLIYFPQAEGRIDYQYEECEVGSPTKTVLVYKGLSTEVECQAWCDGYGMGE